MLRPPALRLLLALSLVVLVAGGCGAGEDELPPVTTVPAGPVDAGVELPTDRSTTSTTEAAEEDDERLSPVTKAVLRAMGATQTAEGVEVPVEGDVLFDTGSSTLRPDAAAVVGKIVTAAKDVPRARVRITGHTDAQGDDAPNQALSERRARAFADAVTAADTGLGARLEVLGRGESQPVADNATPDGRQRNRRVDVLFVGVRL